jgi:sarcosine oxidase/L-pipecolate oxidase
MGSIFCDPEKAFDCVDHYILLFKLKFYGIKGKYYALYESYLSNRYTKTVIYNDINIIASDWLRVRQGVPQGFILGPLMFLLYINDLPKILNCSSTPVIFADGNSILFSHSITNDFNENKHTIFCILNAWF